MGKFAGKKIHEALVIDRDTTLLVKECKVMSALEHPNIVKFCGIYLPSPKSIPALVMELMHQSLDDAINDKTTFLKYKIAFSILIDVAKGLAYLHCRQPRVLHRDLTAKNVLLDQKWNAKITDFGNSRIIEPTKIISTMTEVPGTGVYMPPEAFVAGSKYDDQLDIFSFGQLALYALTCEFPCPLLPPTYFDSEHKLVPRNEIERREQYMDTLKVMLPVPDHHLYPLIEQCLHNEPEKRPSATELLFWLQEIQRVEEGNFEESMECGYIQVGKGAANADKTATALQQMQAYINKRPVIQATEKPKVYIF